MGRKLSDWRYLYKSFCYLVNSMQSNWIELNRIESNGIELNLIEFDWIELLSGRLLAHWPLITAQVELEFGHVVKNSSSFGPWISSHRRWSRVLQTMHLMPKTIKQKRCIIKDTMFSIILHLNEQRYETQLITIIDIKSFKIKGQLRTHRHW